MHWTVSMKALLLCDLSDKYTCNPRYKPNLRSLTPPAQLNSAASQSPSKK